MTEPHPSTSSEQLNAENTIKSELAKLLGVSFVDSPSDLDGLQLDGYAESEPPILVEVFAHVGSSKSGQKRKLSRDMTKLLLAERRLDCACRKILAVVDDEAIEYTTRGWDGEFAREFGIEFVVVPTESDLMLALRKVQDRQRR